MYRTYVYIETKADYMNDNAIEMFVNNLRYIGIKTMLLSYKKYKKS